MKTNNIANRTNGGLSDPIADISEIPRPVVALARDYPDGHEIALHRHERAQLLYASSGVMTVTTENGIWVVPPMRAVWIPAMIKHQIMVSGKLALRTLYFKPDAVAGLPKDCCVVSVPPLLKELMLYAMYLPRLYSRNSPEERIMDVIIDQVQKLKTAPLDLPIPRDRRLLKIFKGLSGDPADNRSLDDWGHQVGASSRTLARLYRSETGMSFRQWRQQIRILEALRRLAEKEAVTNVAMDLGYDSPSAFIAMFKKAVGKTPGQYFKG